MVRGNDRRSLFGINRRPLILHIFSPGLDRNKYPRELIYDRIRSGRPLEFFEEIVALLLPGRKERQERLVEETVGFGSMRPVYLPEHDRFTQYHLGGVVALLNIRFGREF